MKTSLLSVHNIMLMYFLGCFFFFFFFFFLGIFFFLTEYYWQKIIPVQSSGGSLKTSQTHSITGDRYIQQVTGVYRVSTPL